MCNGVLPKWINLLAKFAAGVPFIESMLPAHWVRPALLYESDFEGLMKSCETESSEFFDKDSTHSTNSNLSNVGSASHSMSHTVPSCPLANGSLASTSKSNKRQP
ncbi:unnamed protein product [Echinostoma caproni]|uniref:Uncharacterized protein n=1 Tax=Echinostoma caproni TaxID=27848 RepID=A0A3P8LBT5_9TREM|nr:unnamed protein product [Echinostoma caproni]